MDKSKIRILAVDDHLLSLRLISKQLELMGFQDIQTASNGEEALKRLGAEDFDVVFLDWAMPVKDGFTLLKECRADSRFNDIAFVMLSSEAQAHLIQEAMDAGAVTYIVKPVTQEVFEEKMKSVFDWLAKHPSRGEQRKLLEQMLNSTDGEFTEALSASVMETIEAMFGQKLEAADGQKKENSAIAVSIMLEQGKERAKLRLVFDRHLLEDLGSKVYSDEELKDEGVIKDAASEVANVVCNKIKAFLNTRGFQLTMGFPEPDSPELPEKPGETTINLHFSLVRNTLSVRSILQVNMS